MNEDRAALEAIRQLAAEVDRLSRQAAEAERNLAAQQAILDDRLLRVEQNRLFTAWNRLTRACLDGIRRVRGTAASGAQQEEALQGSYQKWVAHEQAAEPDAEAQRNSESWQRRASISIVMAVRDGAFLPEAVESLRKQVYGRWELCVAVQDTCLSRILPALHGAGADSRIRHVSVAGGDVPGLDMALDLATGEYVAALEEDAVLSPFALHHVAEALQEQDYDLLYSDEDVLHPAQGRTAPLFKPDWSPELMGSGIYPGNLLAIRRAALRGSGGSLISLLPDDPLRVCHIPRVLYHSRQKPDLRAIAATAPARPPSTAAAGMTAIICSRSPELLERCLASLRTTAKAAVRQVIVVAHEDAGPNAELRGVIERAGAVRVEYRGPFNFSAMNNLAVESATEPNLLFLNDDVQGTQEGWTGRLAGALVRKEIGIAGAVLRYPSGALQHAGITVGIGDGVGHTGRFMEPGGLWPWLLLDREVSAVTGACLSIRRSLFEQLRGFDEEFPNNFNDVDLCFRVRREGYRVLCIPVAGLIHDECQTRPGIVRFQERYAFYSRWADILSRPDPYYSPSLSPTERIALNLTDDRWYRPLLDSYRVDRPRATR